MGYGVDRRCVGGSFRAGWIGCRLADDDEKSCHSCVDQDLFGFHSYQLALLFIAFYGFARAWNWNLDATGACVFVFVLWGGAELGDLVRGALESIPKAQYESAYVLGLSGWQTFVKVILPQALRRLLPASVNLATRIVKTTSLAVLLGVVEVIKVGQQIIDANRFQYPTGTLWIYGVIFFMYFIVCWPLSIVARRLEKRWSHD